MQIKLSNAINTLLSIGAILLPIQTMFVYVFHLPNFVQMIYPFVVVGVLLCLFLPLKTIFLNIDKPFLIMFSLFLSAIFISMIVNWDTIIATGMDFTYFCTVYSKFWDRPDMRLLNWGIIRPIIFFIYICLLFIFLKYKKQRNILLKSLIILAVISCIYSFYQLIAIKLNLPFGSIFSGQGGKAVVFYGLRRVEGVFYEAGPQATFLSPIFCILLAQYFEKNTNKLYFNKKLTFIFLVMTTIVMFLTISPIGFLTPFIAVPFFLILNYRKIRIRITKKIMRKMFGAIVIAILLITSLTFFISKTSTSNFSFLTYMIEKLLISTSSMDSPIVYTNPDSRSVRNYAAIQIFKNNKIVGVGQGGAISHFSRYTPFANRNKIPEQNGIINTHLKILCELGLLGITFYSLILAYPYFLYLKKIKTLKYNKFLIDGLIIGYSIYLLISFQSTLQFWTAYFWMIYVSLITLIKDSQMEYIQQIINKRYLNENTNH